MTLLGLCAFQYEHTEDADKKRYVTIIAVLIFYVFFAFRGYLYSDWVGYVETFKNAEWSDIFSITNKHQKGVVHEPGFTLLCLLCRTIINNYAFLVIVITTIDMLLLLRFLHRFDVKNVAFVFMLMIPFDGLGLMFNLLRNQLAFFIFLNALEYIETRKPLPYFLLCLLALCFHLSAIVFIPLYVFSRLKINRWIFLGVFISLFVFYLSKISIFSAITSMFGVEGSLAEKISIYTENFSASRELSPTGTLEKFSLVALVFFFYDDIIKRNKYRRIVLSCLLLYFVMYYFLAEFRMLSMRLCFLFVFSYWIIWIDVIKIFFYENNRRIAAGLLYMYCVYMLLFNINSPVQEYDNLLFGAKSQEERLYIFNKTFDRKAE